MHNVELYKQLRRRLLSSLVRTERLPDPNGRPLRPLVSGSAEGAARLCVQEQASAATQVQNNLQVTGQ